MTSRVLVIEDETMLRNSVVRGLSKMPGVEAIGAGTLNEALVLIDKTPPDLILSDLDLPGRSGVELIGELGGRGLKTPVVFVSAYVRAFAAQIPKHADVQVLEKPVPLDELRRVVERRLSVPAPKASESAPFGVIEYLQLSCMGRHSVVVEVETMEGTGGRIVVCGGELWSANDALGEGEAAFARLAFLEDADVSCRTLDEDAGERSIETPMEALLLEAARLKDEGKSMGEATPEPSADPNPEIASFETEQGAGPAGESPPPAMSPEEAAEAEFTERLDEGLDALLGRDYERAFAAFSEADRIKPGDVSVLANLERLEELRSRNQ